VIRCEALVVGGGPAGSTCARELRRAGLDVIVADRATFPRDKVCAGWLTPRVFELLELDPEEYRATGLTLQDITAFRTGLIGSNPIETRYPRVVSYAIRRCEFDDYLLRRSGTRVLPSTHIESFRRDGTAWIANEQIEARVVVGAGGHFCPLAKHLRGGADTSRPVVAKEAEFRLPPDDARRVPAHPELLFCRDLEGYGWCVRKGDYVNVGIGRRDSREFTTHVKEFMALLQRRYAVTAPSNTAWRGHAYLASGTGPRPLIGPGMLLVGDAAGLAYPESGEGISPAIESGHLAAETLIAARGCYEIDRLTPYAGALRRLHPPASVSPRPVRAALTAVGRWLLGSPAFTRHVVLDRWFLRT
jgi:geranylgeranyl reductase family protein